jgi:hypothetical protein
MIHFLSNIARATNLLWCSAALGAHDDSFLAAKKRHWGEAETPLYPFEQMQRFQRYDYLIADLSNR